MYDETYGLRFDIYERVHLSDEVVGIDQLEEVELTPHIQIIPSGEQVTVRGSLLLSGAYVGITENEHNQSLEHWIPVEITLPLSRVRSLEDIHVDIEHFDVDLLSTRSLNITGVLSLKGIYLDNQEAPAWQQEQFTVEYDATRKAGDEPEWLHDYGQPSPQEQNPTSEISSYNQSGEIAAISSFEQDSASSSYLEAFEPEATTPQHSPQIDDNSSNIAAVNWSWSGQGDGSHSDASAVQQREQSPELNPVTGTESTWTWDQSPWGSASITTQDHAANPQADYDNQEAEIVHTDAAVREQEYETQAAIESEEIMVSSGSEQPEVHTSLQSDTELEERDQVEIEDYPAEKKEMKVAIGSSNPTSNGEASQGLGFSKLLHSSKQARDKEREVEERQAREEAALLSQKTSGDDLHWQSLFLSQVNEESSFRKVRLCIVQRQDTLDSIAERYQLNAREIALYNRLTEPSVQEGQVIYIPS